MSTFHLRSCDKIEAALSAYAPDRNVGPKPEEVVTDLLADLRHYCDAHGLDFHQISEEARRHWLVETGGASCR